ncbi:hypothetical protein M7I_1967 [Glarea lozoyensis 74030]|uniref:NAD(P)-binding Rossmann-fold containing protein n=1 Tax=Glarea lozoyensis (strain ATCC 74030 / MF5533) TaxID=1104152 RepID=H0EHI7_GLAL7|nr:hypothetical protein M7I_1967 [Glarea lozoyensis 74030]
MPVGPFSGGVASPSLVGSLGGYYNYSFISITMKLLVTGATGFVGSEVIRQALCNPAITSVIAIARKPVPVPTNGKSSANLSKLKSVLLEDWTGPYPENVRETIKEADACIWTRLTNSHRTLAVTPSAAKKMDFAEVTKICSDYTTVGLETMASLAHKPFRFVYTSGVLIERDQTKSLAFLSDYRLMRVKFAKQRSPDVQVTVVKPAAINGPNRDGIVGVLMSSVLSVFGSAPSIHVSELAVVMIDQCVSGITDDPLWPQELVGMGKKLITEEDYSR